MTIELLAPAKDKETAFAAIDCGADAVYIGANSFGARKNASNNLEDIKKVIEYAHKFWAKVHVTLNTILTENELEEAVELAKRLYELGVDALIIQDMGLLKRLIEIHLPIPIHASTQCDNYLPQKIKFFNDIGVTRVILAREVSLDTIKQIHKENPNLELECFVHGALCVSFSGQCYLSQYIGGRSANRGECAQPCRKKYTVETTDGKIIKKDYYALCLKDFNLSKHLEELIEAGITSFKIEGRLKDIGYVKNIVSYYAQKLKSKSSSGKVTYPFTPNPEKSFNRGFTNYFIYGRTDCFNPISPKSKGEYIGEVIEVKKNCFKLNSNIYPNPQDGLCFDDIGFLVNKVQNGYIYPNIMPKLKIGTKIYRNSDVEFKKELEKPVKRQIGLVVNVVINVGTAKVILTDENGVTLEKNLPQGEKAKNIQNTKNTFIKQFSKTGNEDFYVKNIEIKDELPFLPLSVINKFRRELFQELMKKRLAIYNENKLKQKPMKYASYYLKEVDYRANVHNKEAEAFYENCGCKVCEPSLETKFPKRQIELMRTKHCIKYALDMCKSPQNLVLRDDHNNIYPLKFDCKNCEMCVMSKN